MQALAFFLQVAAILAALNLQAQGTFVYDQQSSDESYVAGAVSIQPFEPMGQSFKPSLASVGFIRLFLQDVNAGNALGATVYINLRSGSVSGPILDSTTPVSMPDSFFGTADFLFAAPVAVVPGTTYYFQPVVQTGDGWVTSIYTYGYTGGTAFESGGAVPASDLWFREGIVVPEPSSALLLLLGGAFLLLRRRTP